MQSPSNLYEALLKQVEKGNLLLKTAQFLPIDQVTYPTILFAKDEAASLLESAKVRTTLFSDMPGLDAGFDSNDKKILLGLNRAIVGELGTGVQVVDKRSLYDVLTPRYYGLLAQALNEKVKDTAMITPMPTNPVEWARA